MDDLGLCGDSVLGNGSLLTAERWTPILGYGVGFDPAVDETDVPL